ncbi:MAG: hypothetical protein KAR20_23260, partial [Candidatus Heimdallarchaeota archaeon]|nr:hypothetical protein [Candidatus Heimdallarchaeota archaeon]
DKGSVVSSMAESLQNSMRIQNGISKVKDSVFENPSEENLRKQLHVTMKSLETQSKFINQLALICLVYVSGSNYTSDIAQALIKLGHGEEALLEIFNQKMKGK